MCKRTLRILLAMMSIVYFIIDTSQSSSATIPRSTMADTPSWYHPFFPKSSGNGQQGVLHIQNAGSVDALFQVNFYSEQGAVVKRYYGTVKPGAAQSVAAQALADLPVGSYALRVTAIDQSPLISVVRVKDTSRAVPGLAFDPGVSQSHLSTTFYGGPIHGGNKASSVHLFNPTPNTVNGELILTTLGGTPSSPQLWSLPPYGHTTISFTNQPADFVGAVEITATAAIAALLQQTDVNDRIELQAFNPPTSQHFLPRLFKQFTEADSGDYTTKLFISNPTVNATSFSMTLTSDGNQPTSIPSATLAPHSATIIDLGNLPAVAAGVYSALVNSAAPVIVTELSDVTRAVNSAGALYPGQDLAAGEQRQLGASQLFFPRLVRTAYGYSILTLQNRTDLTAQLIITAFNADGTTNSFPYTQQIAPGSAKRIQLNQVTDGFSGAIVVSSDQPLVGWMDEYVRSGGEPDPVPQPVEPPAPVASFSATEREGIAPLQVQFINTSVGEYTSSHWDFGDGQSSTEVNPTHTYAMPGSYTVQLTVTGSSGSNQSSQSGYIQVRTLQPPTAAFSASRQSGLAPLTVQFTNTTIGDYTSSQWHLGDGQSSTDMAPTHTYTQPGVYTVTLTVDGPVGSHTTTKGAYITVRSSPATNADGWDLDFGNGGFADSQCPEWPAYSGVGGLAVTADNKLLMYTYCPAGFALLRFLADGTLDRSFGMQGQATTSAGQVQDMPALQRDGKIILVGGNQVMRHLPNGEPDKTFALSVTVPLTMPLWPTIPDVLGSPHHLLLQTDDQIVIQAEKGITRFTPNGKLDTTLAGTGYRLTDQILPRPTNEATQELLDITAQPDGKLLIAILTKWKKDIFTQTTQYQFVISRLNRDGSLDHSFANAGHYLVYATTDNTSSYSGLPMHVQPNGQILVGHPVNKHLLRLQPDGTPDTTFQKPQISDVQRFLIDQHGGIIVQSWNELHRFSADGLPDGNFGQNGRLPVNGSVFDVALLQDGSLVVSIHDGRSYKMLRNVKTMNPPAPPVAKPLTLLYAVLDNNLGDGWTRLVNNIEAGVRPDMKVRLLIDGPTDNDVYLYDVMPDSNPLCPSPINPTCDGRYVGGVNFWRLTNENSAHPDSLYQFLVDAMNAYPTADKITLSLIGHGSGWSANVLPGQPSIWRDQNDTVGGMLWDDHPATGQQESRSLSTKALGQALTWAGERTGRKIDLLYLDGCSMGMAEVAYEVRNGARYLLASPNIDWASFNYHSLLPEIANANGRALGERWLQIEAAEFRANPGHPFTLSLLDLGQMGGVATAASALADSLRALVPTQQAQLLAAFTATDRFDSDYDGDLDTLDAYSDLPAFVGQVKQSFPSATAVQQAAESLRNALDAAVVAKDAAGGSPWLFGEQLWQWRAYGGLGIYLPLGQDEARRRLFYHANNLAWTADTTWDEFLAAFWGGNAATVTDMPVCHATTQGCQGLANPLPVQTPTARFVYLPVARK